MKKLLALVLATVMALSLAACGGAASAPASTPAGTGSTPASTPGDNTGAGNTDIAFITDVGNIDDHSFNQYSYEGVTKFCEANGLKANYFRPSEDSDAARLDAMDQAISDGAKVVVMAGYLFAPALEQAQTKYPEVQFLALDVGTGDLENPAANTALITYKEEQCGYLAGYAAVVDGYTELGFLGGMAVPAVVRYGQGFVQGADAAAKELGVTVNMKYWYSGSFAANDDIKAKMDGWYADGTQVVFACGGGIYSSAVDAASANNGKVIGVDVDQSGDSELIITSATKGLSNSVQLALTDCQGNSWKWSETYGGKETKLGAAENAVDLPMATSRFTTFTQEQYDTLFKGLVDGSLVVDNNSEADKHFATTTITVDYQE